ncbi:MAG: DUF5615 family PIN-like protein [bacterium]
MLLLLDENVPVATVRALRAAGHDVYSATESSAGAADDVLLARADVEHRLLITFDRDFGELAVRLRRGAAGGVILLRFVPNRPDEVAELLIGLRARTDLVWSERFSVIDRRHIRQRPL